MEVQNNVNTMQTQMNQLNSNATKVADAGLSTDASDEIGRVLTDNISLENGLDAQINSIKTQDEMFGALLNITA